MKCRCRPDCLPSIRSLSSRRAWIEINGCIIGIRGPNSRSPHGERGLKSAGDMSITSSLSSLSSRRAWIEIEVVHRDMGEREVALLTESVD